MKKKLFFISALFFVLGASGQETLNKDIDSLYREDQFYVGVTYNLLENLPNDMSQTGFSLGFHLGFIRDIPINKRRNIAIGLGLGYSANSFNQNLLINKDDLGAITYNILEGGSTYSKNKFSSHFIELPFEFRWRTSTPESYNFWRIYTGFKIGYMLTHTTKYKGDLGTLRFTDIDSFNSFQYGLTLSAGYNTWNIHLYYGLNPIFSDDAELNGNNLDINVFKLGLIFYIL
tara:strand:+ start:54 stop:746 length:693 start_codon:yes stop_codon:yes gene_type:complete